jgi:hypothetical protein
MKDVPEQYRLGSVEASEQLLQDLYLDLRVKIGQWAELTKQTAQARMGYVGQHLVSVVTGFPGGRSGARGRDLIHPDGSYSEIKTCYRVDQLGSCRSCGARVASIEDSCPECESTDINRMDDSKWLIGIRHDEEFEAILSPQFYYLALFDFVDLTDPTVIRASIWRVDPKKRGFAYCMVDYYKNIRANSKSKAPFNLWPFELKFSLMQPECIYRSMLDIDESRVDTQVFPGREDPEIYPLRPLEEYARSQNLTVESVRQLAANLGAAIPGGTAKRSLLASVQRFVEESGVPNSRLADEVAEVLYRERIEPHLGGLPERIRSVLPD